MTLEEIVKEMRQSHIANFPRYGHKIPTSELSFTAGEYLEAIGKERGLPPTPERENLIANAEVLWKDFVDEDGHEVAKLIKKLMQNPTQKWAR